MGQFRYKAAHPDGRITQSTTDGDTLLAVRSQLEAEGLTILSIHEQTRDWSPAWLPRSHRRLSLREFLIFNQELVTLVKSGIPILQVFDLLTVRTDQAPFRAALEGVRAEIRGGAAISDAMARFPTYFSELYRASVRAGEQTGHLVDVLQRYLTYLKMLIGIREKVTKALAYPAFLVMAGAGVMVFLASYVLPTFSDIYAQNKSELPTATRLLLTFIDEVRQGFVWILGTICGFALLGVWWGRAPQGRQSLQRASLALPVIGAVVLKSHIVRMARTLSTVLAGGIPLVTALEITGDAMTHPTIALALRHVADGVRQGVGLAAALKQQSIVPPMTLRMIEVGEMTGTLEQMLDDVAEFHEGELDLRLNQLTTWIEPLLLLVMGILVGGLVTIMYLPIFQLAGSWQ